MRALRYHRFGGPDVLRFEDVPTPVPPRGKVLVRVRAAAVNPGDLKKIAGLFGDPPPQTAGSEGSGVIAAVGEDVDGWTVGDEAFGMMDGAMAEFALASPVGLAKRPANLTAIAAAAATVGPLTAYQALVDDAHLGQGERILIHGAAGYVGAFAVQWAKSLGATVIGTASAARLSFLEQIGVDETIDYRQNPFPAVAEPVDVVFDTVGGDTTVRSLSLLREGGRLVSIAHYPEDGRWSFVSMEPRPGQMDMIGERFARGELRTPDLGEFDFDHAQEAFAAVANHRAASKVVVRIATDEALLSPLNENGRENISARNPDSGSSTKG